MKNRLESLTVIFILLLLVISFNKAQYKTDITHQERSKINFDFIWQFGRVVPTANNLVKFSIEGSGTGNGNPSSHEPDKANQLMAFNGYCMVLVQSDKQTGEIRFKASSEKLESDEIVVKVK
jgi:hypothetical protein